MEVEKRSSKGGFLQLFDWNVKSKKKLFSNKSDVSEGSKQGKENLDGVAMSRLQQMKLHENAPGPSLRGSDYASSMNNDEAYGIKAPGVVARLMGLDSLPTSDVSEPCFRPFFETHSFRDSHHSRLTTDLQSEYHDIDYGIRNKLDGFSMNPVEARLQKLQNRPIERFQTEVLPPKSAKSVTITNHRLFSPIKSPGFILTRDAAYIMETAGKIIEQSPHSTIKGKMPSVGSNSVPLRIRDLREKMEAAHKNSNSRLPETSQRPKEHSSVKYLKAQPRDRGQNGQEFSVTKQAGSGSLKNKDKPVSLAVQAKVNIQKKDLAASRGNRTLMNQKEDVDVKSGGHFDKKQKSTQRSVQQNRTSTGRTGADVLRQNNQKQNCGSIKGSRTSLKPRVPYQQDRKAVSGHDSFKDSSTSNKAVENSVIGSKKISLVAGEAGNDLSSSKTKRFSGKKRSVNGESDFDGSSSDSVVVKEKERSVKCNITIDGYTKWDSVDRKNSLDVVSFTFTSPIKKPLPESQPAVAKSRSLCLDACDDQTDSKISILPSLGVNVIGGDALSVLLEQKLKELTNKIESSHSSMEKGAASPISPSTHPALVQYFSTTNIVSATEHEKESVQNFQGVEEIEGHINLIKSSDIEKELDSQDFSTISSLEPSFSDGSCITSDSKTSYTSNGSKQYLLAEAHETIRNISAKRLELLDRETDLSDSASSISLGGLQIEDAACSSEWYINIIKSTNWELEYVKSILNNAELTFEEFALGQSPTVMPLNLFDQLESQNTESDKYMGDYFKLERKVWFECVNECLEAKCVRHFAGSSKTWIKWTKFSEKKELLAKELHKEISGWSNMGDLMVDELVDKDMSSQYGKWVDFEAETFEEGVEIEKEIISSLIDEIVADLMF